MAGHAFHFSETVPQYSNRSAALGASSSAKFTSNDVNKLVKLGSADNYVLVSDGDDIEAVCAAVGGETVNNGFSFGAVTFKFDALKATVSGSTLAVGAQVIAGPQAALGTAQSYPVVKAGTGTLFKWRVISLLGNTGAAGTQVLIEPIR